MGGVGARGRPRPGSSRLGDFLRSKTVGQALVEFAIILPVFLFLLVIAVDFGRLFFTYIQVNNAAREAANFGASSPTDTATILARATGEKNAQSQRSEGSITVTSSCANSAGTTIACSAATGGSGPGNTITVRVNEPFTFLTPIISSFFGSSIQMNASATATVLGYAAGGGGTAPGPCSGPSAKITVTVMSGLTVFGDPTGSTPNSGVCNISGYIWTWGDGTDDVGTATGNAHTYPSAGTYTVKLEVTNQGGSDTKSQSITVGAVPTAPSCAKPTANFTWTHSGKTYTYRDASTVADTVNCPITDWLWTFTDAGTSSNAQNPATFSYGNSSSHPVTLKVTNAGGTATITQST